MLHFPVYTDTGKRGRQKERFYGKYTLIIEYLSKENNFSQVATLCGCSRTTVWQVL